MGSTPRRSSKDQIDARGRYTVDLAVYSWPVVSSPLVVCNISGDGKHCRHGTAVWGIYYSLPALRGCMGHVTMWNYNQFPRNVQEHDRNSPEVLSVYGTRWTRPAVDRTVR